MDRLKKIKEFLKQVILVKEARYITIAVVVFLAVFFFAVFGGGEKIEVTNSSGLMDKFNLSLDKITTSICKDPEYRPVAVMLSSDTITRPLSGIGYADVVFEMPITNNGVTRLMAVYQCEQPEEIGSIRSSRFDFIPLAQGMNAIYSHWGGERVALQKLNSGIIDNVDGLLYDGTVYYRKSGIPMPHDGFTSFQKLIDKADELEYEIDATEIGFVYETESNPAKSTFESADPPDVYLGEFEVSWKYNEKENTYKRYRGGLTENEKVTGDAVEVSNVIIMETTWSPINSDYININTVGTGVATIYRNGKVYSGIWEKPEAESRLVFKDNNGKEMLFTKGKIWILIDAGITGF